MLIVLALGFLLLSPFLGLFFAPFMNMTWVSDQHLYLALPFFITFWISIWEKWNVRLKTVILSLIFLLFAFKTFFTSKYFRDDISFYSESLKADFTNLPVVYNLIKAHLELGQTKEAIHLSNEYILMAPNDPKIGGSKYFPKIYELHQELKKLNKP
jgi:hypothetical protein